VAYYRIATSERGLVVLRAFTFAQLFVVLTAWLLVIGVRAPWVAANSADTTYAVYGSYLEQSISSVLAAILVSARCHFRTTRALDCIGNGLGHTGADAGFSARQKRPLVALGMVSLACLHAMPTR